MSELIFPTVRGLTWTVMATPEFSTVVQKAVSGDTTRIEQMQNPLWHFSLIYEYIKDSDGLTSPFFDDIPPYLGQYTDYQTLQGFWLARMGQYDDFLLDCKALGLGAVWWLVNNQPLQLVTDGDGNWFSPLQRNFGGKFMEDIVALNPFVPISVTVNGVANKYFKINYPPLSVPGAAFDGLYLKWNTWQASTVYALGQTIIDINGHLQKVTIPGTSGAGPNPPTFSTTGGSVIDGGVQWQDQGNKIFINATFQFLMRVRFEEDTQDVEAFASYLWTIGGEKGKNGSGQMKMVTARPPVNGPSLPLGVNIPPNLFTPTTPGNEFAILLPQIPGINFVFTGSFCLTGDGPDTTGAGTGGGNSIGLSKGLVGRSVDQTPINQMSGFQLPPGVSPSQVVNVWMIANVAADPPTPFCGNQPPCCACPGSGPLCCPACTNLIGSVSYSIITGPNQNSPQQIVTLGYYGYTGGVFFLDPNGEGTLGFNYYTPTTVVQKLNGTSEGGYYLDPVVCAGDLGAIGFIASYAETDYGLLQAGFNASVVVLIEYTP